MIQSVSPLLLAASSLSFAAALFVLLQQVVTPRKKASPELALPRLLRTSISATAHRLEVALPKRFSVWVERQLELAGAPRSVPQQGIGDAIGEASAAGGGATAWVWAPLSAGVLGTYSVLFALVLLAIDLALWPKLEGAVAVVLLPLPFLGLALPFLWLNDRVKTRQLLILRQLPFHIDLLTLSVEAGLDFTAALGRIVERGKDGPLREELRLMLSEIRVGTPRAQALSRFSQRIGLANLSSFAAALIQADRLGMSLGKVLRTQSESIRAERSQRAEQRANQAPVKILFPLLLLIFPTIWLILAGPIVFSLIF